MPRVSRSPLLPLETLSIAVLMLAVLVTGACSGGGGRSPETTPGTASSSASNDSSRTAQPEPATRTLPSGLDASAAIPLDPDVRFGKLDNGLTYYIRANKKPENRAELRLAVNAGSIQEDDDQRGLAHFVEHMAFNGTENFEEQDLIDYLERIGMRFGPDINAYTSFDETVYMLEVPTDDEEIVQTGFQILEDWAHAVTFEDEEIDKERGVVIEEWRRGRGARGRIRDKQLPITFHGSRYAERITIGDKETLENAPYDAFRRYYRDWYRPDLMAVVAVGDFDEDEIEQLVRKHFAGIENPDKPRERLEYPVPDHEETLVSVVTDPEATSISVQVGYKRPPSQVETVGDLREALVDSLYHTMMIDRLRELSRKADPPFQFGFAASGWLGRTKSMYRLFAVVRDGGVERGLETLLTEARRVEEHGFLQSELDRSKTDLLRNIQRQYDDRDKQESRRFAGSYVQNFLDGDPSAGIAYTKEMFEKLVPGITLEEVNARADQWISEESRVVTVSGPDKEESAIPDEETLLAVFDQVDGLAVTAWVDQVRDEPLVAKEPAGGRIVDESYDEELDLTRWTLQNGITVLLKPTDFKNDEIVLRGYSDGGTSLADDDVFLSASMASSVVSEMGAGNFNRIELEKALTGKVANAYSWIGEIGEGIRASASPKDAETMFQLIYLKFTGARRDEEAFQAFITKTEGWLENQNASPEYTFSSTFSETMSQQHPRRLRLTKEQLTEVDIDEALQFYRVRFADASDFVFAIVGSFELDSMRPLVTKWIGGLPGTGREDRWQDIGVQPPEETVKFEVRKGIEPKSSVRLTFHGPTEWSMRDSHILSSTAEVMRIRLREVLREDMGGVYGVGVWAGISRYPKERYSFTVSFGCNPDRVDELVQAVREELAALKQDDPGEEYIDKVREAQSRKRETDLERNAFWASTLEFHERYGLDLHDILHYDELVSAVTAESVQRAANLYLDDERYVQGVLYPEE